jgi:hypothetical protein
MDEARSDCGFEHPISDELRTLQSRHAARVGEILGAARTAAQAGLDTDLASFPVAAGLRRPPAFTFKLADPADALESVIASTRSLLPGTIGRRLVIRAAQERLIAMTDRHAGRLTTGQRRTMVIQSSGMDSVCAHGNSERRFAGRSCRRRDLKPRHADFDSARLWLSHRRFRGGHGVGHNRRGGRPPTDGQHAQRRPLLEPPGFLMRNYGRGTPTATLLAHVAYGAIVGGFASIAG